MTVTVMIRVQVQGRMIARGPAGPANAERTGSRLLHPSLHPSSSSQSSFLPLKVDNE